MSSVRYCIVAALLCTFLFAGVRSDDSEEAAGNFVENDMGILKNFHTGFDLREDLKHTLLDNYKTTNYPDHIYTSVMLSLIRVDVDEKKNSMEVDGWLRLVWNDHRLVFDANKAGVRSLSIPHDEIWTPDFVLYNSANSANPMDCYKPSVVLHPTGDLMWILPCHFSIICDEDLKIRGKPHECNMEFGSWTLDSAAMNLLISDEENKPDMHLYRNTTDWQVINAHAERIEKFYDCCPDAPYTSIKYHITIKKY